MPRPLIIAGPSYIAIAYATNDQLTLATEVVRYIAAVGPPLLLNLEPEPAQRFLEIHIIQCEGTAIVILSFSKVSYDWVKKVTYYY